MKKMLPAILCIGIALLATALIYSYLSRDEVIHHTAESGPYRAELVSRRNIDSLFPSGWDVIARVWRDENLVAQATVFYGRDFPADFATVTSFEFNHERGVVDLGFSYG
ncbi:MAG: hypothetical protein Q7P63_12835 [Verrucomicrobiota bacterium JB022]|nr:hypothetical protein [Verrucomicrobiota bacterium JB022]